MTNTREGPPSALDRLRHLAASGATGRLLVRGPAGTWWVHLHEGEVCGAEQAGRPTMLVAMGQAGLFTAEAWKQALRRPGGRSWSALAGADGERLRALTVFARDFVARTLAEVVDQTTAGAPPTATFTPGVGHPFGRLASWPLETVLPAAPPAVEPAPVDAAEFLALLEEASPHVRRTSGGALRAC